MEEARVVVNDEDCYFEQAGIRFRVDRYNLNRVLGAADCSEEGSVFDRLPDSMVLELGRANDLDVNPFVRDLLRAPIHGVIQIAWYRDVANHTSEYLMSNQQKRIELYARKLEEYKNKPVSEEPSKIIEQRERKLTASYVTVREPDDFELEGGRQTIVYNIVRDLKGGSFAQILEESRKQVETKSKLEYVIRHQITLMERMGLVREVPHKGEKHDGSERGSKRDGDATTVETQSEA